MIVKLLWIAISLTYIVAASERDVIKQKLREATAESKNLADELEDMLERISKFRNDNKDINVEQEEEVTKEMQLKASLDNLSHVAEEIERVAVSAETDEEIGIVNQMTKILDDVVNAISVDEEEVSEDLKTGNESDITQRIRHIEENIETMITALGEVISRLKGFSPTQNEINLAKDIVEEHTNKAQKRRKNLKRRKPKQYDLEGSGDYGDYEDFSDDDDDDDDEEELTDDQADNDEEESSEEEDSLEEDSLDEDSSEEDSSEEDEKDGVDQKKIIVRRNKNNIERQSAAENQNEDDSGNEEEEKCRDTTATSSVKVCVPDFEAAEQIAEFPSQKLEEVKHCFDVTRTICEESSEFLSREVCLFPYRQSTEIVVAHVTQVAFEARFKKLMVSKCESYKAEGGQEEETCVEDFITKEYRIPTVEEHVEDLIELNIPEARSDCRTFKLEIPEVICRDVTTSECSVVSYLESFPFSSPIEGALLSTEGKCSQVVLTQSQQVCTVSKKTRKPKANTGGPRT